MIPTSNQIELDFLPEGGYDIESLRAARKSVV